MAGYVFSYICILDNF